MATRTPILAVVVGGANVDYLIRGPRFPVPGETLHGDTFQIGAGGKGANQAVGLSRLGCRAFFVGQVGNDDQSELLLSRLREEGVDVQYVTRDNAEPTGVAFIFVDGGGQKAIVSVKGANDTIDVKTVRAAKATIREAQVLSLQLEVPEGANMEAARIAREAGVPIVLDPAPARSLSDEFLAIIDVIRPNASEAQALTGIHVVDRRSAREAAGVLQGRGVKTVAVQAGDEGNLLVWPEGEMFLPELPVDSIDATGAGDAFVAALALAIAEGRTMEEAGHFANTAAALATTKLGAQAGLPTRKQIEEFGQ